ncbi:hypothetical protein [Thalassomonas sp. M1454]|uniref:hypothetical protein n=1 Tax=Thalassomonas sp. M1454 TaxID=2594477 RepID=UPI00117E4B94|nr:hypothetical protein [Thalassomonas sp. M1454]TRX53916.1 hypothetical protein FNN08_13245 [Thalassomonas sp. M1454]
MNNQKKEIRQNFEGLTSGMAAAISAYLIALATKLVSITLFSTVAAYVGTFSLVMLVMFRVGSFFEQTAQIKNSEHLRSIFLLGMTSGLLTYLIILASISWGLPLLAIMAFSLSLFLFQPKKKPAKRNMPNQAQLTAANNYHLPNLNKARMQNKGKLIPNIIKFKQLSKTA